MNNNNNDRNVQITKDIMSKINAIKNCKESGNETVIYQYYKEHGTYKGIEEHILALSKNEDGKDNT